MLSLPICVTSINLRKVLHESQGIPGPADDCILELGILGILDRLSIQRKLMLVMNLHRNSRLMSVFNSHRVVCQRTRLLWSYLEGVCMYLCRLLLALCTESRCAGYR